MKTFKSILPTSVLLLTCSVQSVELKTSNVLKVGKGPNKVLTVDIDNNRKDEVIISNHPDGTVSLLKFGGSGELLSTETYSVGVNPTEIVAFDMNNDNYKDILIANHETNNFHILYNDKKGGFDGYGIRKFTVDTKPHIHTLGAGDFNGDKLPDVAIDSWEKSQIAIYYGTPQGDFKLNPTIIDVSKQPRTNLVVGKIDNDDLSDIVTPATRHAGVSLVLGAEFADSMLIRNASKAFLVKLADANKDGNTDILTVHRSANFNNTNGEGISLLLGNGNGGFEMAKDFPMTISGAPSSIISDDIDGDGFPEIITTNYRTNNIAVIFYDKKISQYRHKLFPVGLRPESVAIGDIDGDNIKETIVANRESDTISLLSFENVKEKQQLSMEVMISSHSTYH